MEKKNLGVKAFWAAALLFVFTGVLMMVKDDRSGGAVFIALGSMFMIFAIATGRKPDAKP